MAPIPDPLETNFTKLSINDFIVRMHHVADKQEFHTAFKENLPEYVTPAPRLRELADILAQARDAAASGNRDEIAKKKSLLEAGQQALLLNAHHMVMVSLHRNDPSVLANGGFEVKHKGGKPNIYLLDTVPEVSPKHGPVSGCVGVRVKRLKNSATIELQMTDQDPNQESSWSSLGMYSRSRIELKGLEPGKRYHFRARYHEDGSTGRWSPVASIIVL